MSMITLTIDGVQVSVPAGSTVLEAARAAGVHIPTLCYMKDLNEIGACRLCVVDTGARALQAACVLPAAEGMNVKTNTPAVRNARKVNLELLLSNHDKKCLSACAPPTASSRSCATSTAWRMKPLRGQHDRDADRRQVPLDRAQQRQVHPLPPLRGGVQQGAACGRDRPIKRGFNTQIACAWGDSLADTACINCGQCIAVCPTGALTERDDTAKVFAALSDPTKHVVVQPAPAVRAALGEEFGIPMGTSVTGKMACALRRLGFDKVFDTDFAADLTIMEEANELVDRVKNGGVLPMITSCSPGWIKFLRASVPPTFCRTCPPANAPHEMEGAVIKSYYAEKAGIDPKDIVVVSVMPCTAKKFEAGRPELGHNGVADVDIVITTRELARMIKLAGIDFANLPEEDFDEMLGDSTGAAVIFGVTGGVMEAALRTAYEVITGQKLEKLEFMDVRGLEGVKEAGYNLNGLEVKVGGGALHRRGLAAPGRGALRREELHIHRGHGLPGRLRQRRRPAHRGPRPSAKSATRRRCAPRRSTTRTRPNPCASRMRTRPS